MSLVFIASILLKGMGAIIEILIQVVITKAVGVADYGAYSAFVNAADLIYWCLFSGIVKCNTYYLSETGVTIRTFKKRYYGFYVMPVTFAGVIVSSFFRRPLASIVFIIAITELMVMDYSSTFMARRKCISALIGEYVLGRFLLLCGIVILLRISSIEIAVLVFLYLIQFLLVGVVFLIQKQRMPHVDNEKNVSLKKWSDYQRADIIQSMIGQVPVILPYLFVGSFEAGVVSVVMLVKKLVNFISGPSFKVFLPEFSRLYKKKDIHGIRTNYAAIMRMQMLFLGPMSVVLLGYPRVLLGVMAKELLDYTRLFCMCSVIFIIVASIGPCSGLMQMTGNERWDNRFRETALFIMFIIFLVMRQDPFFVLYGLCIQAVIENIGKFYFVSRWMNGLPVKFYTYISWWILPILLIMLTQIIGWQDSIVAMSFSSGFVFVVNLIVEIRCQNLLTLLHRK